MADDDESLDDILSTPVKAPEAEIPETPEAEQPGPVRDEHGRFAPKGEDEPEAHEHPEAEQGDEPGHNAPIGAVMAERRKAQAAQAERDNLAQQLAEMRGQMSVLMQQRPQQPDKPKEEPKPRPQMWDDPDSWGNTLIEERLSPFQEQLAEMTFRTSRAEAIAEFGKETVTAAQEAVKAAVQAGQLNGETVKAQLSKSRDPVGDVVRWHQNSPAVQETSLRERLRAELMAELGVDPNKPAAPAIPAKPLVKMPPSLNRIPAGHSAPERDESLDEVLSIPRRRA